MLSALAAIIASQALISGSYTLVHEAVGLNLMPNTKVEYPSDTKGQMYVPLVNTLLWVGCTLIVLYFRSGARMENACGLAITVSMLMMTILLTVYIGVVNKRRIGAVLFALVFGSIETVFFISSLGKFTKGGYVAVILSLLLFMVMICWYRGTQIENLQKIFLPIRDYLDDLKKLQQDREIDLCANNVVYLTKEKHLDMIDRDILYSILDKDPKRADACWFVSVNMTDKPDEATYDVETYGTDYVFRVRLNLGYKVAQRLNVYMRQVVGDLFASGELPPQDKRHSVYEASGIGSFKFCILRKLMPAETALNAIDNFLIRMKYTIRRAVGSPAMWYGLETSSVIYEYVPLFLGVKENVKKLQRLNSEEKQGPSK